jgi:hypothetical protein
MSAFGSDNISSCDGSANHLSVANRTLADDVNARLPCTPPIANGTDAYNALNAVSCAPGGDKSDGVMYQSTDLQLSNGSTVKDGCALDSNGRCVINESTETVPPTCPDDRPLPVALPIKNQVPSVREANGLPKNKPAHGK